MRRIHFVLIFGAALWCLAIVLPALWPEARWLRILFAPLCHQIPERSFWLNGRPLAVCVRCSGFYFGFLAGMLVYARRAFAMRSGTLRLLLVLILCDVFNSFAGLIPESEPFRFASAFLFSVFLTPFVIQGLYEALSDLGPAMVNQPLPSITRKEF